MQRKQELNCFFYIFIVIFTFSDKLIVFTQYLTIVFTQYLIIVFTQQLSNTVLKLHRQQIFIITFGILSNFIDFKAYFVEQVFYRNTDVLSTKRLLNLGIFTPSKSVIYAAPNAKCSIRERSSWSLEGQLLLQCLFMARVLPVSLSLSKENIQLDYQFLLISLFSLAQCGLPDIIIGAFDVH